MRRERIEFAKINAIYTAQVDPDSAYNVMRDLQKIMFPEIEDRIKEREAQMAQILDEELQYVWTLSMTKEGYAQGQKLHWDDAPEALHEWAAQVGLKK